LVKPLLLLFSVIVVTACLRGGLGSKVLGSSSYGGRNYIYVLGAFIGYFALTAQKIAAGKSQRMVKWFFLSETTNVISNLTYLLGPSFYVVYNLVSVNSAIAQAASDSGQKRGLSLRRLRFGGQRAALLYSCALGHPGGFRPAQTVAAVALDRRHGRGLFSGFRSQVAILFVLFAIQFMLEGLWKTFYLPLFCMLGALCLAPMLLFANKMPPAVQRSLAFLPADINPDVRAEAAASIDWRFEIWREVWPEVPKFLLLGKGIPSIQWTCI